MNKTYQTQIDPAKNRIFEQDSLAYLTLAQPKIAARHGQIKSDDSNAQGGVMHELELAYLDVVIQSIGVLKQARSILAAPAWASPAWFARAVSLYQQYRQNRQVQAKWLLGEFILIALAGLGVGCLIGILGL